MTATRILVYRNHGNVEIINKSAQILHHKLLKRVADYIREKNKPYKRMKELRKLVPVMQIATYSKSIPLYSKRKPWFEVLNAKWHDTKS